MVTSENDEHELGKTELAFQIQGLPLIKIAEIISRVTSEKLKFYNRVLPKFPNQILPFAHRKFIAESTTLGSISIYGSWGWRDYVQSKKNEKKANKKVATKSSTALYGALVVDDVIYSLILFFVAGFIIFGAYLVGTFFAWVVGNILTFGTYRYRKEVRVLVLEVEKNKEGKIKKILEEILKEIIKEGGYIKPLTERNFFAESDGEKINQQLEKAYTKYFNLGRWTLILTFIFGAILEGIRYIEEHFFDIITVSSAQAWLYWRYPLLVIFLIGVYLIVYGEVEIRKLRTKAQTNFPL